MESLLFYAFACMAIVSALLLVNIRNTARALFLLFIVLFAMAGLYLFALADFIAITQILVYVGGVLILLIFAFMLSNKELLTDLQSASKRFISLPSWQALVLAFAFLGVMIYSYISWSHHMPQWITQSEAKGSIILSTDNNIKALGFKFMTQYVLPFEIISVFLMLALIGAAHVSRKGDNT
ncbi:NADH-quinone oxidoreductase subunit J family protein [Sphingobacterium haloxyli]|uniref:NADH-quinone oxidoreductase subunit J n=1 Tax=Sphingobacterium haloxyli TaxID=2100533 RepID=A0A2S9J0D1_9SPHI|nr:NADH-quinone oxidoreductase subunit J [Sphingobacterium haloxyli]PRD46232.1 NADH-quinone oxidoreductase subunit N [Sphingobacterium haloxyli]